MVKASELEYGVMKHVPAQLNDSEILYLLHKKDINWKYLNALRELTHLNDDIIAGWLNLSVRTFRDYRKPDAVYKENIKEHVLLLLTVIKHGINVFGSKDEFDKWLYTKNFFLDNETPGSFLNTITGIKFIDDRLTAIEFGDNV